MSDPDDLPQSGEMAPDFALPTLRGETLRLSDFRNRSNLILIFTGQAPRPRLQEILKQFAEGQAKLSEQNTRLLVVLQQEDGPLSGWANLPFTFLIDQDNRAHQLYATPGTEGFYPAVYVIDRYGEIYSANHLLPGKLAPRPEDLFDILQFIEFQCPE